MTESKVKWHLVLFADGSYDLRATGKRLKRQAEASGFFATVTLDNKKTLARKHSEFFLSVKDFISKNPKGFGKWIWKPYLILSKLKEVEDNEGVLYLDAGCYLNLEAEQARLRLSEYFSIAQVHGSMAMQLFDFEFESPDLSDERHSKPFLINLPYISEEHFITNQVQSGIVFIMKNCQNLEFVSIWNKLTLLNNQSLSDSKYLQSRNLSVEDFSWDQSVFSVLYKQSKYFCLPDETFFFPNWGDGQNYPIWAMRWKRGRDPFHTKIIDLPGTLISHVESIRIRLMASYRYRLGIVFKKMQTSLTIRTKRLQKDDSTDCNIW